MLLISDIPDRTYNFFAKSGIEIERCVFRSRGESIKIPLADGPIVFEISDDGWMTLWNQTAIEELINLSDSLLSGNPNAYFFGIGTSPSYVVYAMDRLSRKTGRPIDADYIPFSGRFLDYRAGTFSGITQFDIRPQSATYIAALKNEENYRLFLEGTGFHPEVIIEKFTHSKQKTVILDNIQNAKSYASFLYFMHKWATELNVKNKFSGAFECIALTTKSFATDSVLSAPYTNQRVAVIKISNQLRCALNANFSEDRFVPSYPPEKWALPPEDVPSKNQTAIDRVKGRIDEGILSMRPNNRIVPTKSENLVIK